MTTTPFTAADMRDLIRNSDLAACRAIAAIWTYQAPAERETGTTIVKNGVGFSAAHAPAATNLALWICSVNPRNPSWEQVGFKRRAGGWMTFNGEERCRVEVARHIALRYAEQLASIANGTAPAPPTLPDCSYENPDLAYEARRIDEAAELWAEHRSGDRPYLSP